MMPIKIKGYPMPPSSNNLYPTNKHTGRRFKSQAYQEYEREVARWAMNNAYQLAPLRHLVEMMLPTQAFRVDRHFYHRGFRIMTKDGRPRKNDVTNRFKALDDTISQLIAKDDCYFWCGSFEKSAAIHPSLGEYVDLEFTVFDLDPLPEDQ